MDHPFAPWHQARPNQIKYGLRNQHGLHGLRVFGKAMLWVDIPPGKGRRNFMAEPRRLQGPSNTKKSPWGDFSTLEEGENLC